MARSSMTPAGLRPAVRREFCDGQAEPRCWVSLVTPPGRGAVATVVVCGADAVRRVAARFSAAAGKPLEQLPAGRVLFGRWRMDQGLGEELVVCRFEQQVEIHCHGGRAASQAVVDALVRDGCREVSWQELAWATAGDPISAEAQIGLAGARTERAAAILLDQLAGSLQTAIADIISCLLAGRGAAALERLDQLLTRSRVGLHLSEPFRVVLGGPPNAGKSSLTNALLGYSRSIVFDQPGTTRDVVTAHTAVDGWPVELADTAGLRSAEEQIERLGAELARQQLASADLVLLVFDASQPWGQEEQRLVEQLPAALRVYNKCDLGSVKRPPGTRRMSEGDACDRRPSLARRASVGGRSRVFRSSFVGDADQTPPAGLQTSAVTGEGIPQLLEEIARRLVPEPPPAGAAVPFTQRQVDLLLGGRAAAEQGELSAAAEILEQIADCGPVAEQVG